jgi:hypothetical protein
MIIIKDDRSKVIYARINRRIRWDYAEYCGRWETIEEAISNAKTHFPGLKFEYRIVDMESGEMITGNAE